MGVQPVINGMYAVDYDLFDGQAGDIGDGFKRFMLRSAGNDSHKSFLRDAISNKLANDCLETIENQGHRFAVLFINGEFWGLYQLLERFDDEYLAQHYGGSASNYRVMENPSPGKTAPEDNDPDAIAYFEAKVAIVNAIPDMNTTDAYATLDGIVDMESLIDYVIIETLGGNLDWVGFSGEWASEYYPGYFVYNGNNQRLWYYNGPNDGQFGHDGKFRWMLYDSDKSWGYRNGEWEYNNPNYNTIQDALHDNLFFFNKLMQNDIFRARFVTRFLDALDNCLTLTHMHQTVDLLAGKINEAIVEQQKRWPYTPVYSEWQAEVQRIKDWMTARVNPNGNFIASLNSYMPSGQTMNVIAYAGEANTLPTGVIWSNIEVFNSAKAFDRVKLYGTMEGVDLMLEVNVDVIPRNTTYFIDAGTSGAVYPSWAPDGPGTLFRVSNTDDSWGANLTGSNEYDLIKSKLAQDGQILFNDVSDQLYNGNWGVETEGLFFPVARVNGPHAERLMTGYVGFGDNPDATNFIEYKLSLPAGSYKITTGHYCWWGLMYNDQGQPIGGYPRTMQVLFNDQIVTDPFKFENFGEYGIQYGIPYTQAVEGILSIKINTTEGDGATISFIGVEDVTTGWYKVTYVDWDDAVLKQQRTRPGLPEVLAPQDPSRPAYKFTEWVKDDENSTADNIIYKATYEELPDAGKKILTPTHYEVIYAGETPNLLTSVEVEMLKGSIVEKAITWDMDPLADAKAFDTVILTGTPEDCDDLSMTAIIEVIPQNLVYFIDAGTIGEYHPTDNRTVATGYSTFIESEGFHSNGVYYINGPMLTGSETYDRIKAKLLLDGKPLRNEKSDKMFANDRWGLTEDAYQFPVVHPEAINRKLATGLVGWDDRTEPGYEERLKYVEYQLWLPAGQYEITTGHYCWWSLMEDENGPFGGFPRTMQILFNDTEMGEPFEFSELGHNKVVTNSYTQLEDGFLSIKVHAKEGTDGATLSFIGVEFAGEDGIIGIEGSPDKYIAAYVDEPQSLPSEINVVYRSGKIEPAPIVWDSTTDFTQAKAYDAVRLTGAVAGYPALTFSATIEVIPRNLVYFIDAAAFPEADKFLDWWGDPRQVRCFVESLGGVHPNDRKDEWIPGFPSSPAFNAVSSWLQSAGAPLRNNAPDQFYNGSNGWGINPLSYQFTVEMINMPLEKKFVSGYVGYDNIPELSDKIKYLEYSLYLPAGKYEITTGHYDWWGKHGSNPRAMNILFNDNHVYGPIEFGGFMDQAIVTNTFEQSTDGILNIKVASVFEDIDGGFKDGASLTFIGVQEVTASTVTYTVAFDSNGGSAVDPQTVNGGEKATEPTPPTRMSLTQGVYYTFLGWFKDDVEFDFDTEITSDITLTAKWRLYGDVDDDNRVNTTDATLLARHLAGGWENLEINLLNADVNADDRVNTSDRTILRRFLVGWLGYEVLPYRPINTSMLMNLSTRSSESVSPTISVSNLSGKVGDIVNVPITIENNPGIISMRLYLDYDASKLELVGVKNGTVLGDPVHGNNLNKMPYTLFWPDNGNTNNITGNGEIAKLQFRIKEATPVTPITLTYDLADDDIHNFNLQPVEFVVVNGSISSESAPVTTYSATVNGGTGASGSGNYAQGAIVSISAGTAPAGQQFKNWTTTSAGVTFANAASPNTSFTMPANAVTVTANFETVTTTVSVTGVSLNKSSISIQVGESVALSATIAPANATEKRITWESSDPDVVSVSSSGVVTAHAVGTATITATTVDGGITATCTVTTHGIYTANEADQQKIIVGTENGILYIRGDQIAMIQVYNVFGQYICARQPVDFETQIDNLPKGVLIVRITLQGGVVETRKVVIN